MLLNTVINIDTSTRMIHNICTRTLCMSIATFIHNNTLSNIASSNASNSIITPSTTIVIEIGMINATMPSSIINTGINRCGTAVTTITVVVTVTAITMIAINTFMTYQY